MQMKSKILIRKAITYPLVFIIGTVLSFLIGSDLRYLIQDLYKLSTNNAIHFYGKGLHISGFLYYIWFGVGILTFWISIEQSSLKQKLIRGALMVGIFLISLIAICYIDSNLRLMRCTACEDGTLGMGYNEINYEMNVLCSFMIALIPSIMSMIKIKRKHAHSNSAKQAPSAGV